MTQVLEILAGVTVVAVLASVAGSCAAWALLRGRPVSNAVFLSTSGAVLMSTFLLLSGNSWSAAEVWRGAGQYLLRVRDLQVSELTRSGMPAANLEFFRSFYTQYVVLAFPAWIVLTCLALGMSSSSLVSAFLSRITPRVRKLRPFREWRIPEPLIFGFILACLLKLFRREGMPDDHLQNLAAVNLLVFFTGLYTIGGFSIVSHYFHRLRFPFLARMLGYFLLFNMVFLAAASFGILDVWFDFRKNKPSAPREVTP